MEREIKEIIVEIKEESDIVRCRSSAREISIKIGFGTADQTRIVTTASELAKNIYQYAGTGRMIIYNNSSSAGRGIKLIFEDQGPGFDSDEAITVGFSTSKGLGMGLPGSSKLMDEFKIDSEKGKGTTVLAIKWLRK